MNPQNLSETALHDASTTTGPALTTRPDSVSVQADIAGLSHAGRVRPNNEDHFLICRFGRFLQTLSTNLPDDEAPTHHAEEGYGMLVADGIGGRAAGEAASRLAISLFIELAIQTPDWILKADDALMDDLIDRAAARFSAVNEAIVKRAQQAPELRGMGTTLTMTLSLGTDLLVVHVGDSPVYLYRQGELRKLTRDHTVAQVMADQGMISDRDVLPRRLRHMLTRAIGVGGTEAEPESRLVRLADGDRLLICTDGLTDMVDEADIGAELGRRAFAGEACQALVDLALDRGGRDNVTVIVAGYRVCPAP